MTTVTLPKSEYEMLKAEAQAYERILKALAKESVVTPPTKSRSKIFAVFEKTGKYNKKFLNSFKKGLKRSTFFTDR